MPPVCYNPARTQCATTKHKRYSTPLVLPSAQSAPGVLVRRPVSAVGNQVPAYIVLGTWFWTRLHECVYAGLATARCTHTLCLRVPIMLLCLQYKCAVRVCICGLDGRVWMDAGLSLISACMRMHACMWLAVLSSITGFHPHACTLHRRPRTQLRTTRSLTHLHTATPQRASSALKSCSTAHVLPCAPLARIAIQQQVSVVSCWPDS